MSAVLTPTLQRKKGFKFRKLRELSLPGSILVKEGAEVSSTQVVAQAELPGEIIILRLGEKLGISAKEAIDATLVSEGDSVTAGQVICEHRGLFGLFKNVFKSEHSGKVEFINRETGHVGLRLASKKITLDAYVSGKVVAVNSNKSLVIETNCTYIQGIFGVGGEKVGKLKALAVSPGQVILENEIPADCNGLVLFGGCAPAAAALKKAAKLGAVGFITGSIDDRALADYLGYDIGIALTGNENISMTVIVTEGFGELPISSVALGLLKESEGKEASINGATQVRAGAVRPEVIISNSGDTSGGDSAAQNKVEVGSLIRIIREPYFGKVARVLEMPVKAEKLESGTEVRVLKAEIEGQGIVMVPRANVEIL